MKSTVGRLWLRDRAFERTIRLHGNQDQRTDAWHNKRGTMITASEVTKVWTSDASRLELLLKKLEPPVSSGGSNLIAPLIWGTRFEPVAKRIFEQTTNCTVIDVGCCTHPTQSFLGASPDGLIVPNDTSEPLRYGRLVEFKCPMSRVEKPTIPDAYIHQMQMQMECTGIDECEYVEFRFKQVYFAEWDSATVVKGAFAVDEKEKVIYKPDDVDIHEWQAPLMETHQFLYWILVGIKQDFVPKDTEWLSTRLPALKAFWDDVVRHREEGTKPALPAPKIVSIDL